MATNPNSMVQEAVDDAISKRGEIGLQVGPMWMANKSSMSGVASPI
jgi:hypothetical protein